MESRLIFTRSRSSGSQVADLVSTVFVLEFLLPGRELYLMSPWVSDMPVLRNRHAELRALLPEQGTDDVWLSTALSKLSERGTTVRVVCRPGEPGNEEFVRRLAPKVEVRHGTDLHSKGLFIEHAVITGSMNFTYSGMHLNDEVINLHTSRDKIASSFLAVRDYWRSVAP